MTENNSDWQTYFTAMLPRSRVDSVRRSVISIQRRGRKRSPKESRIRYWLVSDSRNEACWESPRLRRWSGIARQVKARPSGHRPHQLEGAAKPVWAT